MRPPGNRPRNSAPMPRKKTDAWMSCLMASGNITKITAATFTNTIVALRPKTGEFVWHYQMSPNDPFDHDGVNALVQADIIVAGATRKVVMQAGRNGFFYVLDRATGTLIAANNYVKVTWADGVDLKTGRPRWTEPTKQVILGPAKITTYPNISGGTNWFPMSYSPLTGLAYVNTINIGMTYEPDPIETIKEKHERLTKVAGLAIFSSDAMSSVAYATEEILFALVLAGTAMLHYSMPVAFATETVTGMPLVGAAFSLTTTSRTSPALNEVGAVVVPVV